MRASCRRPQKVADIVLRDKDEKKLPGDLRSVPEGGYATSNKAEGESFRHDWLLG
jgi:hypothetical protein